MMKRTVVTLILGLVACSDELPTNATWSDPAPAGLEIGALERQGAVTWKYVGQTRYSDDAKLGHGGRWVDTPGHWQRSDARSQIIGSRQYRDDGSEWVAVDVDEDRLAKTIAAYPSDGPAISESAAAWIEPESYWYEPHAFTDEYCEINDSGQLVLYKLWDGTESWVVETAPDSRERSAVWVMIETGPDTVGMCNGVVIDGGGDYRDWVLTSAHCLYDSNHNLIHPDKITVCALGNRYSGADCDNGVVTRFIGPDYDPAAPQPSADYALLRLSLATSITPQFLSSAADTFVDGLTMRSNAYPVHRSVTDECDTNDHFPGLDSDGTSVDPLGAAREMVTTWGSITAPGGSSTFRWYWSGGEGFSGAPLWYCGSSAPCSPGDNSYVVSVWSGFNGATASMVGPKVRTFRSWALGVID